ncbi:uncharacterized protein LOC120425723 [Culex pipiens pallens]|uniref:uncharacterized protein LOC120425723 n=1 Tax=Culex pipiens pallens TaxID=42434 RepID=UPI001954FEF3|nr:uncharacterized protein LOC120425723 [Culex pipiens pallens]
MSKQLKQHLIRRNNILGSLKLIHHYDDNFVFDRDFPQLKFRLEKLDHLWDEFNEVQAEIEFSQPLTDEPDAVRTQFENDYFELKGALSSKLEIATQNTHAPPSPIAPPAFHSSVRLPELKIPDFHGDYDEWLNFHDLFNSLIHSNHHLSSVQKFQYLKSVLKGDAARRIQNLDVNTANYTIAWNIVKKKYDDKNLLLKQHYMALLSIPSVHKESSTALSELADEFEKRVGVLNKLEESKDHWNSFLVTLLSIKLDPGTQTAWEHSLEDDQKSTYPDLIAYILKRSRTLQSLKLSQTSQHGTKPEPKVEHKSTRSKTSAYHSTNTSDTLSQCKLCKQEHMLHQCDEFKKLSPQNRFDVAKKHGLCLNCLKANHMMKACTAGSCRTCNKRHHTLLHLNTAAADKPTASAVQVAHCQQSSRLASVVESPSSVTYTAEQCHVVPREMGSAPSPSVGQCLSRSFVPSSVSHAVPSGSHNSQVTHSQAVTQTHSFVSKAGQAVVFMLTAYVRVMCADGTHIHARALLDCASEANFVTESLAQALRSKRKPANVDVYGISQTVKKVKHQTTITVSSRVGPYTTSMDFLILPSLTRILPTTNVDVSKWVIPRHLPLADPKFNIAHDVDMIIGVKHFFAILQGEQLSIGSGLPTLRNTVFGYVVAGDTDTPAQQSVTCNVTAVERLEAAVRKFWEVESFETGKALSLEERYCENHFVKTHTRAPDGRYVVRLPIREELRSSLGESIAVAQRRFFSTERKFTSNPELNKEYSKFMAEYEQLGHMEEVTPDLSKPHFYLPHHAIQRPESTTTKTRVVFDASCRSSNNISLNDLCYIGPTVQPPLLDTILRFRLPKYVVTADAEKMYRQVLVHPDDRPLQQILWRSTPNEDLKTYQLNTVTYGTAPAPYLATRVLNQLADDEAENYPLAAPQVKRSFYVDDYLSGDNDENRLMETNRQLIGLLGSGGFTMRKWCSNSSRVLSHIPEELRDPRTELELSESGSIKTLGLLWQPVPDHLSCKVPEYNSTEPITKALILSELSQLFDPTGMAGPVIVRAKMFLQSLWEKNFGWTQELPEEYQEWWKQYRIEIRVLSMLKIPRRVLIDHSVVIELHCFSDASDKAYGACVYVKSTNSYGRSKVNLLISKSRVCPRRRLTIPRLELCAALLGAQLTAAVLEATNLSCPVVYWSDSAIVLHWIASCSSTWKVFVSNRIAEIQRLTQGMPWRHIPTHLNPADLISRGLLPSELVGCVLWEHGPEVIELPSSHWPQNCIELSPLHMQARDDEARQTVSVLTTSSLEDRIQIEDHSALLPLLRSVSWIRRFTDNCRSRPEERRNGFLKFREIDDTLKLLITLTQRTHFAQEIKHLLKNPGPVRKDFDFKSQIKTLNPFIDPEGLLRVHGRLENSSLPFDTKYPIILPAKAHLTHLIAKNTHWDTLHSGPQLLLSTLRQRYWPVRGRDVARRVVNECLDCFHCKPRSIDQMMGPLPAARLVPSRAFASSGVDYCGPFAVRPPNRRGASVKVFVAIVVCMWSKAVHIDMVYDLTSASFINVLKRLVGRRGRVTDLYCDNARTFVGANRHLEELRRAFDAMHSSDAVAAHCAEKGITFHFNPARSPHHGGLWEAAVKSFKHHLYRVMKDTLLTIDDFNTLIVQIEGVLNSRPLTPLSSDPTDVVALTPGHFLVGEPLFSIPEPDLCDISINRLNSFQKMQQKLQHFWRAWSRDYIGHLQNRKKWPVVRPNIEVGTMVLLKQDNAPPMRWKLGRIEAVFPGKDGLVRVVDVRTAHGTYRRAITEVCPLPIEQPSEEPSEQPSDLPTDAAVQPSH